MNAADLVFELSRYSLQIALVVAVGLVLPTLLRMHSPAVRLRFFYGLLALILVLPLVPSLRPAPSVAPSGVAGEPVELVGSVALDPIASTPSETWAWWVLAILGLGLLVRLAQLGLGLFSLRRMRHGSTPASGFDLGSLGSMAEARKAEIRFSGRIGSPVTFGIRRPLILLPDDFRAWSSPEQAAVLAHELSHIERRDWLALLLGELVRSLFWFHPLVQILLSRIRLCREQVVDHQVVRDGSDRRVYLGALLEVARNSCEPRRPLATTLVSRHDLEHRVHSLLKEGPMTRTHRSISLSTALVLLVLSTAAAGWAFPLASSLRAVPADPALASGEAEAGWLARVDSPIQVGGDVVGPRRVDGPPPGYTMDARRARVQGNVILRVVIDTAGDVHLEEVLKGMPMGLTESAVQAIEDWKFEPATLHGEPVAVYYNLLVEFRLTADDLAEVSPDATAGPPPQLSGVVPPVLQSSARVPHTQRAREAGVEGFVSLRLTIDHEGNVTDVAVLRGLPMGLSEAAAAAAYDWQFLPGLREGEPATTNLTMAVDFSLP